MRFIIYLLLLALFGAAEYLAIEFGSNSLLPYTGIFLFVLTFIFILHDERL